MNDAIKWWGYKHINGSYQAKRYFSHDDIIDARESDMVDSIYGPFEAESREDALKIISANLG